MSLRSACEPRRILLVGLMGSGKSAVGLALAEALGCDYLDNEALVGSSKATLVADRGEAGLRAAEYDVTLSLIERPGAFVAALPAGALLDERIVERLLALSPGRYVVWLRARVDTLAKRVAADPADRPWLGGDVAAAIEALRASRESAFARVADLVVDVDDLTPSEVAHVIVDRQLSTD